MFDLENAKYEFFLDKRLCLFYHLNLSDGYKKLLRNNEYMLTADTNYSS